MTQRKQTAARQRTSPPRDKLPAQPAPSRKSVRYVKPQPTGLTPLEEACLDLGLEYRPAFIHGEPQFVLVSVDEILYLHSLRDEG